MVPITVSFIFVFPDRVVLLKANILTCVPT